MFLKAAVGVSSRKDSLLAVKEAVGEVVSTLPAKEIDLVIAFSTMNFAYSTVYKTIQTLLNGTPLIGASTAALISRQGILKHGLGIMALSIPSHTRFSTEYIQGVTALGTTKAGEILSKRLLSNFKDIRRDAAIILIDGLIKEGSGIINGFHNVLGKSFPIIGGSASDNLNFLKTYLYYNGGVFTDTCIGLMLGGGKINLSWGIKHGWKPLGKPHLVTRAHANIIYEIDNKPASSMYEEYLACGREELNKEFKRISIFYPLGIYLQGEKEYLLRNILAIEKDGALVLQGNIQENARIRLMIGTKESCLQAAREAVNETKQNLSGKPAEFTLVFDSVSRYKLLGRDCFKEIALIASEFGDNVPLLGIYTYGEQAPLLSLNYRGTTHFHNQTITVVAASG